MEGKLKIVKKNRFLNKNVFIKLRKQNRQEGTCISARTFRSHLGSMGYNGFVSYLFNHPALEACSQDRIEKLSNTIDSLNPFEEKRDFLPHQFYQKVKIYNLIPSRISLLKN